MLFRSSGGDASEDAYTVNRTGQPDTSLETISFADLNEYTPYMFDGCTSLNTIEITGGTAQIDEFAFSFLDTQYNGQPYKLSTFNMTDGGGTIDNYAFDNVQTLSNVTISPKVTTLGKRPFSGCTVLQDVSFGGGPYFTCENGIIYGMQDQVKTSVVECLEFMAGTLSSKLFEGVKSLAEEAFMGCEIGRAACRERVLRLV